MERYPEVRAEVGELSWMQIRELINAVGIHCKEHPGEWTPRNIENLNMFMSDFVYGRHKGLLVTLFTRIATVRDMHNLMVWHKGKDVGQLVHFARAVIQESRDLGGNGFDTWADAMVANGADPDDYKHKDT